MKRSNPNHPLPCAKLKSFTSLDKKSTLLRFEQGKVLMSTYMTQCQNIRRMETQADTDLNIQANVCKRQRGRLQFSHRR